MIVKKYPLMTCSTEPASGIVFIEFPPNLKVDLAMAQEIVSNRLQFTQNKPHFLISDMSNVRQISAEAREFLQRPEGGLKNILGAAFIGSNPVAALIANIFIKTPKNFHARFFPSRKAALAWIEEHKIKMPLK